MVGRGKHRSREETRRRADLGERRLTRVRNHRESRDGLLLNVSLGRLCAIGRMRVEQL